jgi:hypothetical protein
VQTQLVPMPGTNSRNSDQKVNEFTLNFEVKRETPVPPPTRAGAKRGKA